MSLRRTPLLVALAACAVAPPAPGPDLRTSSGALVARLVAEPYQADRHTETCKPWHRLFAPDGRQLTKDGGGEYEHHRGLFLGWNQVRCGDTSFDFWHCHKGETQRVVHCAAQPGPGGVQELQLDWCAADGRAIVHERRQVAPLAADGATGVRITHELQAAAAEAVLGGDPQHAGAQFRAVQQFAEADAAKVTYLRPATAQGGKDDVWTGCAWTAAVLPFAEGAVTVLRVEHPDNPTATWSTRPYGRFGAMWRATITATAPLRVQVAWLVVPGTPDRARCERLAAAVFAD
jgi:hypothetical protein